MMKRRYDFTNHEDEIIRKHYPTTMPVEEIVAMIPRHSWDSIKQHARRLKIKRLSKAIPWDKLNLLLTIKPRTKTEIAAALGVTTHCVGDAIIEHRSKVYIKSYEEASGRGRASAIWALGNLPDAPSPGRRRSRAKNTVNPFLAAAGMTQMPVSARGRVYRQAMNADQEAA